MKLKLREQIKTLLSQEGLKIKDLATILSNARGKSCSANSITSKLGRGTMTYNEVLFIADLLGYDIKFEKRE